jgi:hypothetical protein
MWWTMKSFLLACLLPAAVASALPSAEVDGAASVNSTTLACEALKLAFKSKVFFPGDANYTTENQREMLFTKSRRI